MASIEIARYDYTFWGAEDSVAVTALAPGAEHATSASYANGECEDLFDVALYDPNVVGENGVTARDESLADLRTLLGLANAALKAGLTPEPVAEEIKG